MHTSISKRCREIASTSWPRNYRRLHLNQTPTQTQLIADGPKQAIWNTVVTLIFVLVTLSLTYLILSNTSMHTIRIGTIALSVFLILLWIFFYIYGTWGPGAGKIYAIYDQASAVLELPQLNISIPVEEISCAGILKGEQVRTGGEYFVYQYLFVSTKNEDVYPIIRKVHSLGLEKKYQCFCAAAKIKLATADLSSEIV